MAEITVKVLEERLEGLHIGYDEAVKALAAQSGAIQEAEHWLGVAKLRHVEVKDILPTGGKLKAVVTNKEKE